MRERRACGRKNNKKYINKGCDRPRIFSETLVSLVYLAGEKSKIHISFESKQIELSSGTKINFIRLGKKKKKNNNNMIICFQGYIF